MSLHRSAATIAALALLLAVVPAAGLAAQGPTGPLSGEVTDTLTGEPVPGAEVMLFRVGDHGPYPLGGTTADDAGVYTFEEAGGASHIGASADGYEQLWRYTLLEGHGPHDLDIDLYPTAGDPAVAGEVVDVQTGEPVGDITLFLQYEDYEEPADSPIPFQPFSSSGSTFEFYRVDADRPFHIEAAPARYVWETFAGFVYDGAETLEIVLEMTPLGWDVADDDVHADGIQWVIDEEISVGYADGAFRPEETVQRGQMATFLTRALDLEAGEATFDDVAHDDPHAEGISAVAEAGITIGYDDNTFRPTEPVTRGQMATFLTRALG